MIFPLKLLVSVFFILSLLIIGLTPLSSKRVEYLTIYEVKSQVLDSDFNSTLLVQSQSFYRFTKKAQSELLDNFTFETDVYLVGVGVMGCASGNQNFELHISPSNLTIDWVGEMDNWGNSWFDVVGGHYFYLRIDSGHGQASDFQFLPYGYGFFIPKGQVIEFGLWSPKAGHGGMFTVYYIEG